MNELENFQIFLNGTGLKLASCSSRYLRAELRLTKWQLLRHDWIVLGAPHIA